jgi:sugar lactone lactonase YvrE
MKLVYILVLAALCTTASLASAETPPQFLYKWGSTGSGAGQFNSPYGIAAGANYVYVVDRGNNRVEQFTLMGDFVRSWGQLGSGDGQFNNPYGIAVDQQGFVYVTDEGNYRVEKFSGDGTFVFQWGVYGIDYPYQFQDPHGISVAPDGSLFVVQGTRFGYLQRWTSGGGLMWSFTSGSAEGCCAHPNGSMSVSFPTCRIQVYLPSLEADYGSCGTGTDQMNGPRMMVSDDNNNTYVAEQGNNRVHKFSFLGQHILMWGTEGSGDGQFEGPMSVARAPSGLIFVTDGGNNRVEVFGDGATPTKPTSWGHLKSLYR